MLRLIASRDGAREQPKGRWWRYRCACGEKLTPYYGREGDARVKAILLRQQGHGGAGHALDVDLDKEAA